MVDRKLVDEWFEKANMDLNIAIHVHKTMRPAPDEPICFHCQQSAEKDLKGFLVFNEIFPPKIHNLLDLLKMCMEINSNFTEIKIQCNTLNRYGIMPWYPNELDITDGDVLLAISYAKNIKEFVRTKLQINKKK